MEDTNTGVTGGVAPARHLHEVLSGSAVSNVSVKFIFRVPIDSPRGNLLFARFWKFPRNQGSARSSLIEQVPWWIRNLRGSAHAQLVC
jgi:hypothetical protein